MKKLLIVGGAVTGAVLLAKGCASSCRRGVDWEKWIERMPENAPPKWMFRNITAIRENTEQILQLLQDERSSPRD